MLRLNLPFILLLTATSPAQTAGGEYPILQKWEGGAGDFHGWDVACAGDVNADGYSDVIVNSRKKDGTVDVYSGFDGALLYRFVDLSDYSFGYAVDGAGDCNGDGYDDLLIGSRNADNAFIYSGFDGSLISHIDGGPGGNWFGAKVSGAGDVNNDGFDDIIVAGYGDGYVYSGLDSSLLYQVPNANWVSNGGDVDRDGFDDFLVGHTYFDHSGLNDAGIATLHSGFDGSIIFQWLGENARDRFGSVGHAGDLNMDGVPDIVVGAPGPDPPSSSFTGQAYAFSGVDGTLLHHWPGMNGGDWMGSRVSGTGDFNGDGFGDVLVSAPWADPDGKTSAGSVFLYSGADGSLLHRMDGETSNCLFGWSANAAGDCDADGLGDLVVGAQWALGQRGTTYVFGFNEGMSATANEISVSTGGRAELHIDFSEHAAGMEYRVLASRSGVGPIHYGVDIPLGYDPLLLRSIGGYYPGALEGGLHGTLDANGDAIAVIRLTAGNWQDLIGRNYHMAVVVIQNDGMPVISSIPLSFAFTQ